MDILDTMIKIFEKIKANGWESMTTLSIPEEAKLIYETLSNSIEGKSRSKSSPQTLSEVVSKSSLQKIIVEEKRNDKEEDLFFKRMKLLAGI